MNMSTNEVDHVSLSIDKKLAESSQVTFKACIFRVHGRLRNENTRAYEPEIIAIGPYHRGKEKLQGMEKHKLRYLQLLLLRNTESSLAKYVASMKGLERRARECYAESINLSTDEFVEMMILDGCFIIELFRKCLLNNVRERDRDDPIFQLSQIEHGIRHDLMLFENQLPLFILLELLQLTKESDPRDNIVDLALNFLGETMPTPKELKKVSPDNFSHLLGLLHKSWCSSFHEVVSNTKNDDEWEFIKSTIELREAGIKFKPHTKSTTLLDIKFEKGILRIPPLTINDFTECVFRNLIAYEQYLNPQNHRLFVTDYVTFMDRLINSAKDAGKLCHDGIIKNWLGDDEAISTMFNKLGNNVYINNQNFSYSQVFNNVNKHRRRRSNRWLANLRESYFNSPLTIISVLAAAVLLVLTLILAIFSVLSYTKIVEGTVHINGKASIGRIDEDFICATLDWWPPEKCDYGTCSWGTASLLNLDLSNTTLLNAIKAFSPLKIRLGGTLQDKVIYQSLGAQQPCTQFVLNSAEMFSVTQGCLPMSRWDELNIFFKKSRAKVIFGLNALSGRTIGSDGSAVGAWNSSNAESLIRYTVNKGYSIHGWELGNELSGNGIGASVAADQYVSDVNSLQNIVQNIYRSFRVKPLVLGPGGFFDVNWFTEFIDKTNNSLQVATHHIYNLGPGVDDHLVDKILDPSYLDGGSQPFSRLQSILKSSGTSTTAWVGEAGGAYNSGHNLVTNAFVFSFWYLDQLGMSSSYDTKTYCRQTLIGGNYGLLNTTTFAPNPDYYSALLWHRLMGRNVLSTSFSGTNKIRAYAHCSKISAGITLLLINLDGNTTVQVGVSVENATTNGTSTLQQTHLTRRTKFARIPHHFKIGKNTREEYHLTAKDGDLHSQTVLLNGKILTLNSSGNIPPLEPIRVNLSEPITVAPFSIVFVHIHSIHVPACR